MREGLLLHFRGVPEPKDNRGSKNLHYALDQDFPSTLRGYLEWCNVDSRAAYVLPGVVKPGGTGKADVLSLPCILIDFDKGNPDESLKAVEDLIGPATVIVESGGRTEAGAKLHAYWRLSTPATLSDVPLACAVREELANRFNGDPSFKQAAQVIRIPGSVHFKGQPKLVTLRTVRQDATVNLQAVVDALNISSRADNINVIEKPVRDNANVLNFFDYRNVELPGADVERALTQPIREGGQDDITRFEGAGKAIGHFIRMVREGRYDLAGAWEATKGWNQATLVPPWDEDRLRTDFDRLVRQDIQEKGALVAAAQFLAAQPSEGWQIGDWRSDRFQGAAPARQWLVDGLVPLATAGVFAAVGDAGKSMLALRLALFVTTYAPAPKDFDVSSPRFFGQPVIGRGAAVILTAEDDDKEVHRRLAVLDPTNARNGKPLFVVPMISAGGIRSIIIDGRNGPEPTQFWQELRMQLLAIPDLKLVVLDPLSSFVSGDTNDNTLGASLMAMLGELAASTGAAVMLVHHFNKGTTPTNLSDARNAVRGAAALVDNGRWALVMWEADQDEAYKVLKLLNQKERAKQSGLVYFGGLTKGNAGQGKVLRTLVRGPSGVLEDMTDQLTAVAPRSDEVDDLVHKAMCAHKQERPRWSFPLGKSSIDKHVQPVLKAAKIQVTLTSLVLCLDRLLERGLIVQTDGTGTPRYEPLCDA